MHAQGTEPRFGFRQLGLRLRDLPHLEFTVEGQLAQLGQQRVFFALLRTVGAGVLGLLHGILEAVVNRVEGC